MLLPPHLDSLLQVSQQDGIEAGLVTPLSNSAKSEVPCARLLLVMSLKDTSAPLVTKEGIGLSPQVLSDI